MQDYGMIAIELIFGFIGLFLYTKMLGKAHFAQLTPFDFISALVLGDLLGNAVYEKSVHVGHVLFATALWGLLIYSMTFATQKWNRTRKPLEGEPNIVIRNGQLDYNALKSSKVDLNELLTLLRQKDVFSLAEVEYAIMETNGMLSVMKKKEYDQPVRQDLNIRSEPAVLPVSLILDGELIRENLAEAGVTEAWLKEKLKQAGATGYKDVFFAEWNGTKEPYISLYNTR